MRRRTPEGMTEWEAGQELIKANDKLREVAENLKPYYPKYARELTIMANRIGRLFNGHGSHEFGLPDGK